jgi:hypothetical protein
MMTILVKRPREIPDGFPGATDLKKLVKQTSQLQTVCIVSQLEQKLLQMKTTVCTDG